MNNLIIYQLSNKLYEIGKEMGFSKPVIRSNNHSSEIYVKKGHALQIEIDWKEYELFMYVVYLRDDLLPEESVVYRYKDGHWCRKFVEEIYKTKRPHIKNKDMRYSPEYLFSCFEFYAQLIRNDSTILTKFFKSIDLVV